MKLFQRNRKPVPQTDSVKPVDPEDQPFEQVKPPTQVQPELMQMCASCGVVGATVPLKVSYFGYVNLPFVRICDACEEARKTAKEQHYIPLRKTLLETPAIPKRRKAVEHTKIIEVNGPIMA